MGAPEFHTACQERVYNEVRGYLDTLVEEHFDDAEHCDFYLEYGSTIVEISIEPYQQDNAVIEIVAFCVYNVDPSIELTRELLVFNAELPIGAFSMVNRDVFYSHAFLGRKFDPDQLISSLDVVAMVADEYDDRIVARYGGERALDRLRSWSRRKKATVN
ncbi:MAG: hypothetical protein R3338_13950 [Thermoanaerobaculia bacterium]|nr:hypothetical protein [Thermoanaerobaculia bacterium]